MTRGASLAYLTSFALLVVAFEHGSARCQELPIDRHSGETENRPAGGAPSVSMPIAAPGETEVVQPERNVINQNQTPTFPLEEPLNPDTYVCGRGDVFELNFWGRQNFRLRFAIDIEGKTFISKVGYVDITGKSLSKAREIVKKAVSRLYPGLMFELSLVQPRTFLVHVVEFVNKPGIYRATPVERVSAVLSEAGGATGSTRRVQIKRRDGTVAYADLVRFDQTGDSKYNPYLQDGDVVRVPFPAVTVSLQGAVERQGRFELIETFDLAELISLSGGLRSNVARTLPIRVRHRGQKELDAIASYSWPADGSLPKIRLADGDMVLVPSTDELQPSVLLVGPVPSGTQKDEVTTVRRIPYYEGVSVRTLIEANGGVSSSADLKNAYVRRADKKVVHVDLERLLVMRDFSADVPVYAGDTVVMPQRRFAVLVEGAVARPGIYQFDPSFGGREYVATAGGPTKMAQGTSDYRLVTPAGKSVNLAATTIIQPGDTIVVPERTFSRSEIVQLVMGAASLVLSTAALGVLVFK